MEKLSLSTYQAVFQCSPVGDCLLALDFTILDVNDVFLSEVGRRRQDLIGQNYFVAFPGNPDDAGDTGVTALHRCFMRVVSSGAPQTLALQRYPIQVRLPDGGFDYEERFWSSVTTPVYGPRREVACLSLSIMDVTGLVSLKDDAGQALTRNHQATRREGVIFSRAQTLQEINAALEEERGRLRHLFDHAPSFVYFTRGPEHFIEQANEAFHDLAGWRQVEGRPMREVFPEVEGQGFFEILDDVYRTGMRYTGHKDRLLLRDDWGEDNWHEHYVDLVYQPIVVDGKVVGICGQGQDITDQKRAEDELRSSEERWKLALEASGGGVWDIDVPAGKIRYSETWKAMLGYSGVEISDSLEDWDERAHPDDRQRVANSIQAHLQGQAPVFSAEYRVKCHSGEWKWILSRGAVVKRDEQGSPLRIIGTSIDVSQSKRTEHQIWLQANFDPLTQLPNRRLFRDRLEQEVRKAARSQHCAGLLFIDLDRFKEVNDLLGHDAGDQLLVEAAERISRCVRASDTVARLGGDEFTVILTELEHKPHVEEVAAKIIDELRAPFVLGQEVTYISGSVGITIYPYDAQEPEELIRNADQAMYWAKKNGRNQFRYFTRELQEQAQNRLRLSGDLRNAIPANEFEVYYQPIVTLDALHIDKAEALLRWRHPKLGFVAPGEFIPLAEELGLINQIGDWVFRQAAERSRQWTRRLHRPFEISVNRSPVQFVNKNNGLNWPRYLEAMRRRGYISVEITESLLVDASSSVLDTLLQYRDAGIPVALDDFGTGYSSMAYLKKFDIDYLKIDQSFVHDIETNSGSRTIAKSMIVMAHELGLKAIAEGIETPGQADILRRAGCDYGQGYLFSRPLPAKRFDNLLSGRLPFPADVARH